MPAIELKFPPQFEERAKLTYENYDLVDIVSSGDERYTSKAHKPKKERKCLFCGGAYGLVTFKSDAHLLSKYLGNSDLFSDFECHQCNLRFGKMEDDLSKFLGISKALAKGGEMESFKGRFLSAHSRSFIGNDVLILAPKDVSRKGNKTFIRYVKNPYSPINVYKALVKFALSMLPGEEVKQSFPKALAFLAGKQLVERGAVLSWYTLPFNNTLPLYVLVFRKKNTGANLPTYMMSFYFNNFIINLPLLLHEQDVWESKQFQFILPPPYFANERYLDVSIQSYPVRDFASAEKVTDDWERLIFEMPEAALERTWTYNSVTDRSEKRHYKGAGIKYLVITKEGVLVDPKTFSEFVKKQMEDRDHKADFAAE